MFPTNPSNIDHMKPWDAMDRVEHHATLLAGMALNHDIYTNHDWALLRVQKLIRTKKIAPTDAKVTMIYEGVIYTLALDEEGDFIDEPPIDLGALAFNEVFSDR